MHSNPTTGPPTSLPADEDLEIAMALSASIQSAKQERPPFADTQPNFEASSSSGRVETSTHGLDAWNPTVSVTKPVHTVSRSGNSSQHVQIHGNVPVVETACGPNLTPSAPPIDDEIAADDPIHYPSIDLSPVDISSPAVEKSPKEEQNAVASGSSCVICLDAPAEGACIPCGHVAGCMSCLNEVKAKKWGCPVCREKIDQVIKIYHV